MDTTIIHADIFFYITTIIVIILGFLCAVILFYVVSIVRRFAKIAKHMHRESQHLAADIAHVRHAIREEASKVNGLWKFLTGFVLNPFASAGNGKDSASQVKKKKKSILVRNYKKRMPDEDEIDESLEDISDIQ